MFQMRSPIMRKYFSKNKTCTINQLFGANLVKYNTIGHTGIDFQTQGVLKYITGKMASFWNRGSFEKGGTIPIQAAHDGFMTVEKNYDKEWGIKMRIETEPIEEDGELVKYETFYFHLDSVIMGKDDGKTSEWEQINGKNFIKEGMVFGYGGNTGKLTTGAHLHFELRKYTKVGENWINLNSNNGYNGCIDPMPYFKDYVVFETGPTGAKTYFNAGKKITKEEMLILTSRI